MQQAVRAQAKTPFLSRRHARQTAVKCFLRPVGLRVPSLDTITVLDRKALSTARIERNLADYTIPRLGLREDWEERLQQDGLATSEYEKNEQM